MTSFRLLHVAGPVLLALGFILLVPTTDALGQGKKSPDHVILVLPKDGVCATTPDTLRGVKEKQTIAFFAVSSDISIDGLKSKPHNRQNGVDLSDTGKVENVKQGELSKKVKIKEGARGFYTYSVTCGGMEDDPPGIIVD